MGAAAVLRALGPIDARSILRDPLLRWMLLMPLLIALLFRVGLPPLARHLTLRYGFELAPYHPLIASVVVMITPMLNAMVIGFLLLDQKDDRTLEALLVTPLTARGYFAYRMGIPMLVSVVWTVAALRLSGVSDLGWSDQLLCAVGAAPLTVAFAAFLAAFARNKVQGFALMKAAGVVNWPPVIAWFVPSGVQWAFGLCPTYWPAKLYWELDAGGQWALPAFAIGFVYLTLLTLWMLRRFEGALHA